jgi:hypothetical protein
MSKYHDECYETMKTTTNLFPIEVDLPQTTLNDINNKRDVDSDSNFHSAKVYHDDRTSDNEGEEEEEDNTDDESQIPKKYLMQDNDDDTDLLNLEPSNNQQKQQNKISEGNLIGDFN